MQSWDLKAIEALDGTRSPTMLETADGARAIVIRLARARAGTRRPPSARAGVVNGCSGSVHIEAGPSVVEAEPGTLLTFEPGERHSVVSEQGAQILLILAPWPGDGHYRADNPA